MTKSTIIFFQIIGTSICRNGRDKKFTPLETMLSISRAFWIKRQNLLVFFLFLGATSEWMVKSFQVKVIDSVVLK